MALETGEVPEESSSGFTDDEDLLVEELQRRAGEFRALRKERRAGAKTNDGKCIPEGSVSQLADSDYGTPRAENEG